MTAEPIDIVTTNPPLSTPDVSFGVSYKSISVRTTFNVNMGPILSGVGIGSQVIVAANAPTAGSAQAVTGGLRVENGSEVYGLLGYTDIAHADANGSATASILRGEVQPGGQYDGHRIVNESNHAARGYGLRIFSAGHAWQKAIYAEANPGRTWQDIAQVRNLHGESGDMGLSIGVGLPGEDNSSHLVSFTEGAWQTLRGSITRSGSGVAFNTASDERLKHNIRPSVSGLAVLDRIDVRDFEFVSAPDATVQGLIAQELFKVYPQAVHIGGDDAAKQPWSIDYSKLVPLLIAAVQELQEEVRHYRELALEAA